MNPAEFLLDLANGNINDVSVPSELDNRVRTENLGRETRKIKPSAKDVHEVNNFFLARDESNIFYEL